MNPDYLRGLVYTVHPRLLVSPEREMEYRIVASARRRSIGGCAPVTYGELYERARLLLSLRVEELRAVAPPGYLQTWIAAHGWFSTSPPAFPMTGATITIGVRCTSHAAAVPEGHAAPTPEQLQKPFVDHLSPDAGREWDEFYNDFDFRKDATPIVGVSYGEYVTACDGVDLAPVRARAAHRTRRYLESLGLEPTGALDLVRQEANCIETGKASRPRLAFVEMVVDLTRPQLPASAGSR